MANDETSAASLTKQKAPRWWPLIVILGLALLCLTWIWNGPAIQRQERVLKTGATILVALLLGLGWLMAFSRLRWRVRLTAALLCALVLALSFALFRFGGVTGDLVPIFTPRWRSSPSSHAAIAPHHSRLPDAFPGFPQFLGPTRNGIVAGPALARDWQAHPPDLLWRVAVGEGYAGFAIAGERAVCLEQHGANEAVVCRDLFSGKTLWTHEYPARFENSLGGIGPRTTPAIDTDRVFALGATGKLHSLDLRTGKILWQRDILADANVGAPDWGVSGSPLVVGNLVIVHPGGPAASLVAYRADSGERAWAGGNARAGYSSPQFATLLGEPQFLIFNHDGVAGHAATDGHVLWRYGWTHAAQHVTDPRVISANRLVVSTGYGAGADLVELSRELDNSWKCSRIWHSQRLKSKFASLIADADFIYGLDDGRLTCLALASGDSVWKGDRVGHGQLLLAGDLLVATTEDGAVVLLEPRGEGTRELGRFTALPGKMWNPPALAPPFFIIRTEQEAACYRLPLTSDNP